MKVYQLPFKDTAQQFISTPENRIHLAGLFGEKLQKLVEK